jgi:hypothetical protein
MQQSLPNLERQGFCCYTRDREPRIKNPSSLPTDKAICNHGPQSGYVRLPPIIHCPFSEVCVCVCVCVSELASLGLM